MENSLEEARDIREKRLQIRSMRRGTKEMDIILEGFFAALGRTFDNKVLDKYEALLDENDQDLYQWVSGQTESPVEHDLMINRIKGYLSQKRRKSMT